MFYTKDSKQNLVRHEMKAYRPFCAIACSGEQYYEELLNKTPAEQKKVGIQELNFLKKQMDNAYEVIKGFDKLAANKLLTKGADSCAVLNFEDIGTYAPTKKDNNFSINLERAEYWISKGAQPSDTVASFIRKSRRAVAATK